MQQPLKILFTGGHAVTTALATIEELIRRKGASQREIFWVGSKFSMEGKKVISLNPQIFEKFGVKTYFIFTGKLQRKLTFWTIPSLFKVPIGFIHAWLLLTKIKPNVVVSFGGYAAFPIVVLAWLKKIPVIVHEQVASAGLANRLSIPFASKICLSRARSQQYFPLQKSVLVGNPVLTQISKIKPKKRLGKPPLIFITTGSRGSQIINRVVKEALPSLLKSYRIVHLVGELDFKKFSQIKNPNYESYPVVDPLLVANFYRQADIVVARAGANTVSEIMATKRPALLIPIPWSYLDEQMLNAQEAKSFGIAEILLQDDLTKKSFLAGIDLIRKNWQKMVKRVSLKQVFDKKASSRLVDEILSFFK